jgi:hypothetical protein
MFTVWVAAGKMPNDQLVDESQRALTGFVQLLGGHLPAEPAA